MAKPVACQGVLFGDLSVAVDASGTEDRSGMEDPSVAGDLRVAEDPSVVMEPSVVVDPSVAVDLTSTRDPAIAVMAEVRFRFNPAADLAATDTIKVAGGTNLAQR